MSRSTSFCNFCSIRSNVIKCSLSMIRAIRLFGLIEKATLIMYGTLETNQTDEQPNAQQISHNTAGNQKKCQEDGSCHLLLLDEEKGGDCQRNGQCGYEQEHGDAANTLQFPVLLALVRRGFERSEETHSEGAVMFFKNIIFNNKKNLRPQ